MSLDRRLAKIERDLIAIGGAHCPLCSKAPVQVCIEGLDGVARAQNELAPCYDATGQCRLCGGEAVIIEVTFAGAAA
jgi:hypothetical protein